MAKDSTRKERQLEYLEEEWKEVVSFEKGVQSA